MQNRLFFLIKTPRPTCCHWGQESYSTRPTKLIREKSKTKTKSQACFKKCVDPRNKLLTRFYPLGPASQSDWLAETLAD